MVEVIEQNVKLCLPSTRVNMVFMQPYVHFVSPLQEPYQWQADRRDDQIRAIEQTLEIAAGTDSRAHAHFIVFPEYSIPGLRGIRAIDDKIQLDGWPRNTIIIGGADGLSRNDYRRLCEMSATQVAKRNAPNKMRNDEWVNSAIVWTKDTQGVVTKWIQPKLKPCEIERNTPCQNMFEGGSIYLFSAMFDNGSPCRFFSVVCFDWIAAFNGANTQQLILSRLDERWKSNDPKALHWIFVIQQNAEPNDADFLRRTEDFLLNHNEYQHVNRRFACVVMANNALQNGPCKRGTGAFTSFVFEPNTPFVWDECRPTVSVTYSHYRQNGGFQRCRDVTFREMGPCIQCASVAVVPWVGTRTRDRCSAVEGGAVYPLKRPSSDPRFPEKPVPPYVKWANDGIDSIDFLAEGDMRGTPLEERVTETQNQVQAKFREVEEHSLGQRVRQATWLPRNKMEESRKRNFENVDLWDTEEEQGLEHVIYVLSLLALCNSLQVKESEFHGTMEIPEGLLRIVAIRGPTHEDCRKHYDRTVLASGPYPVLLVTRDRNNLTPTEDQLRKIYEPHSGSNLRFKAYQALIDICRRALSQQELRKSLADILEPHDAKFI